jgi:hypothetical protein
VLQLYDPCIGPKDSSRLVTLTAGQRVANKTTRHQGEKVRMVRVGQLCALTLTDANVPC